MLTVELYSNEIINRQRITMVIVVLVGSTVMFGTEDTTKNEQELFHVWTSEPDLTKKRKA